MDGTSNPLTVIKSKIHLHVDLTVLCLLYMNYLETHGDTTLCKNTFLITLYKSLL